VNLLLDIGNTSLRWCLHSPGMPLGEAHTVSHAGGVPLDLLAAWEALERPSRVLMANVAGPQVGAAVSRVVSAYWGLDAEPVAARADCLGVRIAYADPGRLGVDRWLALLAARAHVRGAVLVVDAGTAVTYDGLLATGEHLGGQILPGIAMMREALLARTRLPPVDPAEVLEGAGPWSRDTAETLAAGGRLALAATAEHLLDDLAVHAGGPAALLVTGGDGPRLAEAIARSSTLAPALVLEGLARLVEEEV
jgi:type III pantothenate kinase